MPPLRPDQTPPRLQAPTCNPPGPKAPPCPDTDALQASFRAGVVAVDEGRRWVDSIGRVRYNIDNSDLAWSLTDAGRTVGVAEGEFNTDPESVLRATIVTTDLTAATTLLDAISEFAAQRSGRLEVWISDPTEAEVSACNATALEPNRRIHQLRIDLPLQARGDAGPGPLEAAEASDIRAFDADRDSEAILRINAAAFRWHPEQGDMSAGDLAEAMNQSWFSARGFLVAIEQGEPVGFCWTKIHHNVTPELGEIYVICVDPDHSGKGWGRQLVTAGLAHLHKRGLTVGMLYVESDNKAALRMYESLGFVVHHTDWRFEPAAT